jgi:hypothetical protein
VITISLAGENLTTADLGWLSDAVAGASGHSGNDYPIQIVLGRIVVEIPGEEEEVAAKANTEPLKVGDQIRILSDRPSNSHFKKGEIAKVVEIDGDYAVEANGPSGLWWVKTSEYERVAD